MKLSIIAENRFWIAINKPAGLIVEKSPFESPTIEDLVWEYLESTVKKPFLGIVHRLDRVTSGVLILAKKKLALKELNQQFSERSVEKVYHALTEAIPENREGELINWLEKDQKNKKAILHTTQKPKTKQAVLNYKVLNHDRSNALLEIKPATGRFHQIRAQLAQIDCPIVGDAKYGAVEAFAEKQIALHAYQLDFTCPLRKERMNLTANAPFGLDNNRKL